MATGHMKPGKYFISHSYRDAGVRDHLLTLLPGEVEPFVFPPINVSPLQFVSDALIGSILTCDGMIYVNEGFSARSFWVAFERDYALRSTKPVYAYVPSRDSIFLHQAPPLDLAVFPSYTQKEKDRVMPILSMMREQRYFDVWIDTKAIRPGSEWALEISTGISSTIERGGYVVVFWGRRASESRWVEAETLSGLRNGRVVVAGLDNMPMPDFMQDFGAAYYVQLVNENGLNHNRIDDLIVRLYWLIFRNQFPELVYE